MYSKIHTLYVREERTKTKDEYGRIIADASDVWREECACRCDDNTTQEFRTDNANFYRPQYHVVCEGYANVNEGDYIKCVHGGSIRGEGKVFRVKHLNFMKYTELWV